MRVSSRGGPVVEPVVEPGADVVEVLVGFAATVRAAGVPVTPDRTAAFLAAVAEVGVDDRDGVYWAGRSTLCGDRDHLRPYDLAFEAWFTGRTVRQGRPNPYQRPHATAMASLGDVPRGGSEVEEQQETVRAAASDTEVLRHRDVGELDDAARDEVRRLLASLDVRQPLRRASRRRRARHGELDVRRTLREELRRGGEPGPLRWTTSGRRPRRVVWLVDVSGSMAPYADVLLRLAHTQVRAAAERRGAGSARGRARVEVFTIGTRLTRVTTAMQHRDVEAALKAAGEQVPDWSGGTRLGEVLRAFADRWGQRGVARGAVLVICSDGWERGDTTLLAEQVERLHRLAHRLVWVNPHRGKLGYEPVQAGIAAVLPHVDDFVAGHSVASYVELMEVLAGA
ncbi:MAG TPA: VWA domain-containing protein [Actinomycetales bacterium]|nr:VWA domain-containing protein [Actinomycetales bacterium]